MSGALETAGQISGNVVQSLLPAFARARARAGGTADAVKLAADQPSSTKVAILVGAANGMLDRRDAKRLRARNW